MLRDFESYDRKMRDAHSLKATYIRKQFKHFVDEVEVLAQPNTKVFYESYDYLVRRKSINRV